MKSFFKITLTAVAAVLLSFQATAQVKIGSNPTVRNANSELEIESTNKGLLLPRVALTNTTAFAPLSAHVQGMVVYNTATAGDVVPAYYYNDGAKWVQIGAANSGSFWGLTGNAATTPPTQVGTAVGAANYWGTSDAQNLGLGTNGTTRMIFDQKGNAFGGNLNTMAADSNTLVWGGSNIVTANGHNSLVVGHQNVDSSNFSLVFGLGNTLGANVGTYFGSNRGTILGGGGNKVVAGASYNSIINGSQNNIYGACFESIITGYQTTVSNSQKVVVSGQGHNVSNATGSAVLGNFNTVNATHTLVAGSGHLADVGSDYTAIFGNTNKAYGINALVAGTTNIDSSRNSFVFGNNNILGSGLGLTPPAGNNRSNRGTILGGGGNQVVAGETYNSIINGSDMRVYGSCFESIIIGFQTTVSNSQKVVVSGQGHNVSNATGSAVFGNFSTVSATSALVAGAGNNVKAGANYGIALGESNTVEAAHLNSMAIGKSATTTAAGQLAANFAGGYGLLGGNVGIGTNTPSTLLHVNGGTTSPAVKIVDGTEGANKVLTSDASGNASWQTAKLTTITGVLPSTGPNMASGTNSTWVVVTGASITLPPGKWLVNMGSTAQLNTNNTNDGSTWLNFALNDNTTTFAPASGANTTGGTSDYISTLSGNKTAGAAGRGMQLVPVNGVIAINNSTGSNKTYYVWAKKDAFFGGTLTQWSDIMGSSNLERYFYALPIN